MEAIVELDNIGGFHKAALSGGAFEVVRRTLLQVNSMVTTPHDILAVPRTSKRERQHRRTPISTLAHTSNAKNDVVLVYGRAC